VKDITKWTQADYERSAREYCAGLPLEHFMEATPQATQREITLESLALVKARRPDLQVFNELLVQYPINAHVAKVVPDNMVVLSDEPILATGSYNLPFEQVSPFWVLEYVSEGNPRKDYHANFLKYQDELKVPYYLLFRPDNLELQLHHHNGFQYERIRPNAEDRLSIPKLEIEVALHGGWVRFWYQGELFPLPAELQSQVDDLSERLDRAESRMERAEGRAHRQKQRADREKLRADEAAAEVERLRVLVKQLQGRRKSPKKRKERG
jgi:Uma2 family endonuclease